MIFLLLHCSLLTTASSTAVHCSLLTTASSPAVHCSLLHCSLLTSPTLIDLCFICIVSVTVSTPGGKFCKIKRCVLNSSQYSSIMLILFYYLYSWGTFRSAEMTSCKQVAIFKRHKILKRNLFLKCFNFNILWLF